MEDDVIADLKAWLSPIAEAPDTVAADGSQESQLPANDVTLILQMSRRRSTQSANEMIGKLWRSIRRFR